MKFILGKKLEMTQIFQDDGRVVPVTAVLAEPNVVTQIKTVDKDKYSAVQIGFGGVGSKHISKPQIGHLKGLANVKTTKEFAVNEAEASKLNRGDVITVEVFAKNDEVAVIGTSKGKGYQGVVRRHGFHGSPASHGHKDQLRMSGSIGAGGVQRVFKNVRMAGRMGDDQITVTGLSIVDIDPEKNILYVKGAVPGARNGLVLISGDGEMKLKEVKAPEKVEETKAENSEVEAIEEAKVEEIIPENTEIKE